MRHSVLAAIPPFQDSLEGVVDTPYLDIRGLVTVGVGNLVNDWATFSTKPWLWSDNSPANATHIASAWETLNADSAPQAARPLAQKRSWRYYAGIVGIHLAPADVDALVRETANSYDAQMATRFTNWADLCADAQLATLSLCWADGAYGVGHKFPRFDAALLTENFCRYAPGSSVPMAGCCAAECHLDETGNPPLVTRNARNVALFVAAQRVADSGGDPDVITGWSA